VKNPEEKNQNPVEQRRFIEIQFAIQGRGQVITGYHHLKRYQRPDGFITDQGRLFKIEVKGRNDKEDCPKKICCSDF
jgi:hypothetical protein